MDSPAAAHSGAEPQELTSGHPGLAAERPMLIAPDLDAERPRPIVEEPDPEAARRQEVLRDFTGAIQSIDPEEFDLELKEMVRRFRGHLERLFDAMQHENQSLALTHRGTICHILEASLTARELKKLFKQFEKAHEIAGTTVLQQDVGEKHRKVMSLMAMLDSILNRGNGAWELIQSDKTDLARAVYGLGILMSEEEKDLELRN